MQGKGEIHACVELRLNEALILIKLNFQTKFNSFEELQVLPLLYWLHFSAPKVDARSQTKVFNKHTSSPDDGAG